MTNLNVNETSVNEQLLHPWPVGSNAAELGKRYF